MAHLSRSFQSFLLGALLTTSALNGAGSCDDKGGVISTLVLKTTTKSSGDPVRYPVALNPEVTAAIIDFPPGAETGWHLHTVPVYAWVVAGNVSIELEGGRSRTFKEGEAIVETVGVRHIGRNTGSVPARLLVFYTGAEGVPNARRTP